MRAALTAERTPAPPDDWLADFHARLNPTADGPVAAAYSGGGDSLAALLATRAWAAAAKRPVIALIVDHGLQAQSDAWAARAAAKARDLGIDARILIWTGNKPQAGLSAAARAARHRLLAEAARDAGARVIVFGHTADDVAEAALMRAEGSSVGAPRPWAPSPAWPEGRGLFILRPLLRARRAAIREALWRLGQNDWIEDPANADPRSARARARARLTGLGVDLPRSCRAPVADLAVQATVHAGGWLTIDRARLRDSDPDQRRRFIGAAVLSVGGGARPPRPTRVAALAERLAGDGDVVATLAGAKLIAGPSQVLIVRDAGEAARGGLRALVLAPGETGVWDGRFEVTARATALTIEPLAGRTRSLKGAAAAGLKSLPAPARGALPSWLGAEGARLCPILGPADGASIRSLIAERLLSASGAISKEPAA